MFRRPQPFNDLERLEREGNDEFHLLAELGPQEFSLDHLFELRQLARARLDRFDRLQRLNMMLALTGIGWLILGGVGQVLKHILLTMTGFTIAAIMFLGFIGMAFWLKKRFESRGEVEAPLHIIEEELRRRAVRKPQKPRGA